jgi:hypothetical protein
MRYVDACMGTDNELLAVTQFLFSEHLELDVTLEQARACQDSIVGFFRLLADWQRNSASQSSPSSHANTPQSSLPAIKVSGE